MAADGSFYLQKGHLFPSLGELLTYYKANWKLIQNPLLQPCVSQVGLTLPCSCPALLGLTYCQRASRGSDEAQEPTLGEPPHSGWGSAQEWGLLSSESPGREYARLCRQQ